MSDSILSQDDEKVMMKAIKSGFYKHRDFLADPDFEVEELKEGKVQNQFSTKQIFEFGQTSKPDKEKQSEMLVEKVADMVENLGEYVQQANKFKLNKKDYISCLRSITKQKILTVKESRKIFDERVKKLIRAQQYELRS